MTCLPGCRQGLVRKKRMDQLLCPATGLMGWLEGGVSQSERGGVVPRKGLNGSCSVGDGVEIIPYAPGPPWTAHSGVQSETGFQICRGKTNRLAPCLSAFSLCVFNPKATELQSLVTMTTRAASTRSLRLGITLSSRRVPVSGWDCPAGRNPPVPCHGSLSGLFGSSFPQPWRYGWNFSSFWA